MAVMELFWQVEDQAARLAELISREGDLKEIPLRRDVRSLGMLLGMVIREQAGEQAFIAEEELRHLAIQHRQLHDNQGRLVSTYPASGSCRKRRKASSAG